MSNNKNQNQNQTPQSSSSTIFIPEDIITDFILPDMVHLAQIDKVVNKIHKYGDEPIRYFFRQCAARGETSGIRYICSNFMDHLSNQDLFVSLLDAINAGRMKTVQYFCELQNTDGSYICNLSDNNNIVIRSAARRGNVDIVKYLCQLKNDDGLYRCNPSGAIYLAVEYPVNFDTIQYFCELRNNDGSYRCDLSDHGNEVIRLAAMNGRMGILKYLCGLRNVDGSYRCNPSFISNTWLCKNKNEILYYLRKLTNDNGSPRYLE